MEYPYVNHMNIRFGGLELIDVQQLADDCIDTWYNQTLCAVNDSVVRLGVMEGEYHWHQHDDEDEGPEAHRSMIAALEAGFRRRDFRNTV